MTTDPAVPSTTSPTTSGGRTWQRKAVLVLIGVVILVIAYFILAAFLPRWWSIRVSNLADQTFTKGITWGLVFGIVCTFLPLVFFWTAWAVRKRKGGKVSAIVAVVLAVATAVPNLLTLTIVLGSSNAAHAGERTLDTEAPGFRGATAAGAVIAIVLFAFLAFLYIRRGRRKAALLRAQTAPKVTP